MPAVQAQLSLVITLLGFSRAPRARFTSARRNNSLSQKCSVFQPSPQAYVAAAFLPGS